MGRRIVACLGAVLLASCSFAAAPRRAESRDAAATARFGGDESRAESSSGTWIIVELSVPASLRSMALDADEADDRRASIREAQDGLLAQLTAPSRSSEESVAMAAETVEPPEFVRFESIPYMAVRADAAALTIVKNSGYVVEISVDHENYPLLTQSGPLVRADAAWSAGYTGKGWTVAVVDTGVNFHHQFLPNRVVAGSCFTSSSSTGQCERDGAACGDCVGDAGDPRPGYGGWNYSKDHGTHVAGIVCGGAAGIRGIAPDATILSERVFTRRSDGKLVAYDHDIIRGLEDVLNLRSTQYQVAAVNMSLGGEHYRSREQCDAAYPAVKKVVDRLAARGIVTVAASGNEGTTESLSFPAALSNVVSVGATDKTKNVVSYSNSAVFLDFLAPGDSITSSVNVQASADGPGTFGGMSGTSMAAPHVAGALAVLRQRFPAATSAEIVGILRSKCPLVTDPRNKVQTPFLDLGAAIQ